MKKTIRLFFPFWFALLSSLFCLFLYGGGSFLRAFPMAVLVFFAALGWSAMVFYRDGAGRRLKIGVVFVSVVLPVLAVELLLPFRQDLFFFRTMYLLIILGILGIRLYLYNLERRNGGG
jgi:hypothetical protein